MNGWVRCLSSALDSGLLLLDEEGELSLINERTLALLDCDESSLVAAWPQLRQRIEAQHSQDLWTAGRAEVEVDLPIGENGGSERRFLLEIVPVDVEDCRGHVVQIRDYAEVSRAERDLLLASQMHSISALYRSMAHDLRAPLNAMVVNLELLADSVAPGVRQRPDLEERRRRYVRVLKEEMGRLNRHLLAFLSQSAPALDGWSRFDLVPMLREMALFVEPQASKQGTQLELDLPDEGLEVEGRPDAIRQAVLSLVVNALEAVEPQDAGRVEVGLRSRGDAAVLWVGDDGPGIPPTAAAKIFDLHYTTKRDGSGIGLHVARAVIERHSGTLTLARAEDPELQRGALFELVLPKGRRASG